MQIGYTVRGPEGKVGGGAGQGGMRQSTLDSDSGQGGWTVTGLREFFESLPERLQTGAHVKAAYGEPITTQGKTIVPVARVGYGFGGGVGTLRAAQGELPAEQGAGGGGGGVGVVPIGVVEITPDETRFIPFSDPAKTIGALLIGCCLGILLAVVRR